MSKKPANEFKVIITEKFVKVEHPGSYLRQVSWTDIQTIKAVTTDEGPHELDFWLALIGKRGRCVIPLGARGYNKVYRIVSKYRGFDFENAKAAMTCLDNEEFVLWTKKHARRKPVKNLSRPGIGSTSVTLPWGAL
jgi:hypothetical protein